MSLYDIEKVSLYLDESIRGLKITVLNEVTSTNDYAKKAVSKENDNVPMLILAREQSAGRGQQGRKFYSPKDCGIYMSLIVNPQIEGDELPYITLMCGICVKDALEKVCGINCKLKYVNDVLCNGKKICGILTEAVFEGSEQRAVVIGIGINVKEGNYPDEIRDLVTCVQDNIEENINANKLVAEIVNNIFKGVQNFNIYEIKKIYFENIVDLSDSSLIK